MRRDLIIGLATLGLSCGGLVACGGDDGGGGGGDCASGATSSDNRYLPFAAGNTWRFQVTDVSSGEVSTKVQTLAAGPSDGILIQTTMKSNGRTESQFQISGDAIVRLQQEDYNGNGELQQTTTYTPSSIRLDEASARVAGGASYNEDYGKVVIDADGTMSLDETITEEWTVMADDAECTSPLGTFSCLQIRRRRTAGGVADKTFFFARGIGKVREEGGQLEELVGCTLE